MVTRCLFLGSLLMTCLMLLIASKTLSAPLQQEGCYLLSSESYDGSHWIRDWPTGWPTAHDDRIALGDFSGWHARTVYFNHVSNTTVATYDGGLNPQNSLPRSYILILDSSYSDGVGFLRTYNNQFTLELCPPAIPTPTPTATATPDPTITPLSEVYLELSTVLSTSQGLVTRQSAAWMPDSDTFQIFTGTAFFLTVFGVLSIIVTFMRQRWFSSDDAE